MITLEEFSAWMRENATLSDSSVYKYTRAVNTISNEMKEKGVITESLLAMSALQLDVFVPLILHDPDFVAKNKTGNNMYSNALKQFRYFTMDCAEDNDDEIEIIQSITEAKELSETEKKAIIKARVGQGTYRTKLLQKYHKKLSK